MTAEMSRFSLRIMLGLWLLMMVVLINAYTGTLTSHITAPKLKPIPQSLEELANRKSEYQITIMENYLLADYFLVQSFFFNLNMLYVKLIYLRIIWSHIFRMQLQERTEF